VLNRREPRSGETDKTYPSPFRARRPKSGHVTCLRYMQPCNRIALHAVSRTWHKQARTSYISVLTVKLRIVPLRFRRCL